MVIRLAEGNKDKVVQMFKGVGGRVSIHRGERVVFWFFVRFDTNGRVLRRRPESPGIRDLDVTVVWVRDGVFNQLGRVDGDFLNRSNRYIFSKRMLHVTRRVFKTTSGSFRGVFSIKLFALLQRGEFMGRDDARNVSRQV